MIDWWSSLLVERQIFYAIGVVALGVLLLQLVLMLVGVDGYHDADFSGHGDHPTGMGLLSIRTVTAFFVGFGWGGATLLNHGYSVPIAILGGSGLGLLFLLGTAFLVRNLLRLQSTGNLDYRNAIDVVGTIYSTVPAAEAGGGQIELVLQGRLMMAEAYTKAAHDLKPGSKARVVELIGQSTLLVEPLTNLPTA